VYMMDLQGDRKLVPVLSSPAAERVGGLSPDSRWLAYTSNETGAEELFVTSFPMPGARWQVSSGGAGGEVVWSADGKNLRYHQGDKVFNVEVRFGGVKPEFSAPKELVTLPPNLAVISLLPDNKRILTLRPSGDTTPVPIDFVLNWEHLVK